MHMGDEIGDMNDQAKVADMAPSATHAYDDVNISEEVSRTGIWHHLNSQPAFVTTVNAEVSQPKHRFALLHVCCV